MIKTIKIIIPESKEFIESKFQEMFFKYKIDFSILDDEHIFYTKTINDFEYLSKGSEIFTVNGKAKVYDKDSIKATGWICYENDVVEFRYANQEEIKTFYKFYPEEKFDSKIDFSILNDEDVFYVEVNNTLGYLFKGRNPFTHRTHYININTKLTCFEPICPIENVTYLSVAPPYLTKLFYNINKQIK